MKTITIKYGVESITKQVDDDFSVSDLREAEEIRAVLGYGDNINVLNGGVTLDEDSQLVNGSTYVVETACNQKAARQSVTIKFGIESVTKEFDVPVTIGQLRANQEVRAVLGYGDNVNLLIAGSVQSDNFIVPNNSVVVVENRANQKARI